MLDSVLAKTETRESGKETRGGGGGGEQRQGGEGTLREREWWQLCNNVIHTCDIYQLPCDNLWIQKCDNANTIQGIKGHSGDTLTSNRASALVECCFMSTETTETLVLFGREPRTATSTFTH